MDDFILYRRDGLVQVSGALRPLPAGSQMVGFHINGTTVFATPDAREFGSKNPLFKSWTYSWVQVVLSDDIEGNLRLALNNEYPLRGTEYPVAVIYANDWSGMEQSCLLISIRPRVRDFVKKIFPKSLNNR